MAKRIVETHQREQPERERGREIAAILAEGYMRLIQTRRSTSGEIGESGENGAQESPSEQLDSFGHRSDE